MNLEEELEKNGKITIGPLGEDSEIRDTLRTYLETQGLAADLLNNSAFLKGEVSYELARDVIKFSRRTEMVYEEKFYPGVIEPSFGIGRIVYAVLEHAFSVRAEGDDEEEEGQGEAAGGKKAKKDIAKGMVKLKRSVLSFKPAMAPVKAGVGSLLKRAELDEISEKITKQLTAAGMFPSFDPTGNAIGKKYSKTDEIGTPFFITVDPATLEDQTVTVRERDTGAQVRVPLNAVVSYIVQLCTGTQTWSDLEKQFPRVR